MIYISCPTCKFPPLFPHCLGTPRFTAYTMHVIYMLTVLPLFTSPLTRFCMPLPLIYLLLWFNFITLWHTCGTTTSCLTSLHLLSFIGCTKIVFFLTTERIFYPEIILPLTTECVFCPKDDIVFNHRVCLSKLWYLKPFVSFP